MERRLIRAVASWRFFVTALVLSSIPGGVNAQVKKQLSYIGLNPSSTLAECEGDCDVNSDCAAGLHCFQRRDNTKNPVPGCTGETSTTTGKDFCAKLDGRNDTNLKFLRYYGSNGLSTPMERCAGDCDANNDCAGTDICFSRPGLETVPGCYGAGHSNADYCVDVKYKLKPLGASPSKLSSDPPVKLGECEGDCDKDSHCEDGLMCFQRGTSDRLPGCSPQPSNDHDYCITPTIHDKGLNPGSGLQRCQGDCDSDGDCTGDLVCYQRDDTHAHVPGCAGTPREDWYGMAFLYRLLVVFLFCFPLSQHILISIRATSRASS